jgi:hypothetical protein
VFGASGVRFASTKATAHARVELADRRARLVTWDLATRTAGCDTRDAARIVAQSKVPDGGVERVETALPCADDATSISHVVVRTHGSEPSFGLNLSRGSVELHGLVAESERGVVVDAFGIIGARADSPLWRDAAPMRAEISRRQYDLVLVAYGTNESMSDKDGGAAYAKALSTLIDRIHAAVPEAECVVIGPPDRGERAHAAPSSVLNDLVAQALRVAREHHCAWFDSRAAMGGPGGHAEWAAETPPLAATDHVHLTPVGYRKLGALLAESLVAGP